MEKVGLQDDEWKSVDYALTYLAKADKMPHRVEGEKALLDQIPKDVCRILDLGTGDGRLLGLLRLHRPNAEGVALDFSETMLQLARNRFAEDRSVKVLNHDLNTPLSSSKLGYFDAIVTSFAVHHLTHERKKQLYKEIFDLLSPSGVFCNLEHVASPTKTLHQKFRIATGNPLETEDPSNKYLNVETQLYWLRKIGFVDVDCYWKWLELALMVGFRPKN